MPICQAIAEEVSNKKELGDHWFTLSHNVMNRCMLSLYWNSVWFYILEANYFKFMGEGLRRESYRTARTVKSLCSFSYSKRCQTLRWNFACHMEQESHCTKGELLLTCRWTTFVWLSNIKSFFKVTKCISCIFNNAVFSSLASLGKPQGFLICSGRRLSDLVGLFLTYESLQYQLTARSALQIHAEDYTAFACIPGLPSG